MYGIHLPGFLTLPPESAPSRTPIGWTLQTCFHNGWVVSAGNEELWVQPALEMPKRRDILAIVLIVLPWTLLITVWHQSTMAPFSCLLTELQEKP
ncbi:Galactosylgalactosylxylosylprotein 3-beta-glucuronosyltransferase 1 [Tupaia chinensis]|uniref:Galactosylgalactosylxylosylprotein 3-beta-glucuronosyltransferase 1 n=1 Tax=Tupaia chinensis TaxID=246437 RepID=L9KRE6_TUPCH|nr:Galactosylgalactosylxylosylprotein 3-beta-glucuronosyltransferase 1 [Tupaia chinensis]